MPSTESFQRETLIGSSNSSHLVTHFQAEEEGVVFERDDRPTGHSQICHEKHKVALIVKADALINPCLEH